MRLLVSRQNLSLETMQLHMLGFLKLKEQNRKWEQHKKNNVSHISSYAVKNKPILEQKIHVKH